jgi:hypothetical protein
MRMMLLAPMALLLSGCAGFTFYTDKELTTETAIPIPQGKPHLLLVRTGAKDKPVEASIVYITNYEKLIYAKPNSGFGSSNLSLAFANGQMTAFGQQTDTKIPELVSSIGGLLTAHAGAAKSYAEADQIRDSLQAALVMDDVGKKAQAVAKDIAAKRGGGQLGGLTASEASTLAGIEAALLTAAAILVDPTKAIAHPAALDTVREQAKALGKYATVDTTSTARNSALQLIAAWKAELDSATKEEKAPEASFELYEIEFKGGKTILRKVVPDAA